MHDSVAENHFNFVRNFSKETGDVKSLSWTDMKVMALGVALSEKQGELDRVKKHPKDL